MIARPLFGEGHHFATSLGRNADSARVLEFADDVDQLHARQFAGGVESS